MTVASGKRAPNRRQFNIHFTVLCGMAMGLNAMPFKAPAATAVQQVLVVGDSLSAEYGLARGTGWVSLLKQQLAQHQPTPVPLINASISGDTTAGGRARLPALLQQHRPSLVIIELGGNDGLRGLPLSTTQANLQAMAQAAKAIGAKVLLVGMQVPPNYGRQYSEDFVKLFTQVKEAEKVALVPFLLKGVADSPEASSLFQSDGIHPNEKAQAQMMNNVWPLLKPML